MKDHWGPWDTGTHVDVLNAAWGGLRGDRRPGRGSLPQRMGVQGKGKMPVEDLGISGKETEEFFTPGLEDTATGTSRASTQFPVRCSSLGWFS